MQWERIIVIWTVQGDLIKRKAKAAVAGRRTITILSVCPQQERTAAAAVGLIGRGDHHHHHQHHNHHHHKTPPPVQWSTTSIIISTTFIITTRAAVVGLIGRGDQQQQWMASPPPNSQSGDNITYLWIRYTIHYVVFLRWHFQSKHICFEPPKNLNFS